MSLCGREIQLYKIYTIFSILSLLWCSWLADNKNLPGLSLIPCLSWMHTTLRAFLVDQMVKNLPACVKPGFNPWVRKIPWRRAWQPISVFLSGESPWTEEPGGLQSMGSQRVRQDWATKRYLQHWWFPILKSTAFSIKLIILRNYTKLLLLILNIFSP